MIDIGVNFTNERFSKDRADVVQRARVSGIQGLLVTGTSVIESQKALQLCHQSPDYLRCTAGVHPHDADAVSPHFIEELTDLARSPLVKAIGECGLDYNRNFSTPENQLRVFKAQVALAAKLEKPLFLHQRDAFEAWYDVLSPFFDKVPALVSHCFTGNREELDQCLAANMYIGITGWVCDERRGQELQDIVKHIPLSNLMIETDAPYLTPRNIKPRPKSNRNEPSYLAFIVDKLAELMPYDKDEIIHHSQLNARRVFNWEQC